MTVNTINVCSVLCAFALELLFCLPLSTVISNRGNLHNKDKQYFKVEGFLFVVLSTEKKRVGLS